MVRGGESYAKQMSTVTWWQLEPRMTVLVVMEVESHHATLDLSAAELLVLLDSGPGQWEPELSCPLVRLLYRGTVEESLSRVETVRRVLQDIKTNPGQDGSLSKQTVAEIVSPQPDNGYTKRKEKVRPVKRDLICESWQLLQQFPNSEYLRKKLSGSYFGN